MFKIVIAASATLLTVATPAFAADAKEVANPAVAGAIAAAPLTTETPSVRPVSATQRYCVIETLTDSRIPRRSCHTRADWLAMGFDPIKK